MAAKKRPKKAKAPRKPKPFIDMKVPSTDYDKIFAEKLEQQYKEFRGLKEHALQSKKFIRVIGILLVIILLALLLLTFS